MNKKHTRKNKFENEESTRTIFLTISKLIKSRDHDESIATNYNRKYQPPAPPPPEKPLTENYPIKWIIN